MTFALERHHLENHSAFLQKGHALHTPEVQIELHQSGTIRPTYSTSPSMRGWAMWFPMSRTCHVFIVRPSEVAQLPMHGP